MAENLEDGEFWLPSEFLTDDFFLQESARALKGESKTRFPDEFPYGLDSSESSLSSPVESLVGSTESDEEDFSVTLRSRMAGSLVIEGDKLISPAFWNGNPDKIAKVMAGSPQSTLCELGNWSRCGNGSSRASSKGPSQVSSPPTTPMEQRNDHWELLQAAAGQIVRMKAKEQSPKPLGRGLLCPPKKPPPLRLPPSSQHHEEALKHLQMQHEQFQRLKRQQLMKQHCSAAWGKQRKAAPEGHPLQGLSARERMEAGFAISGNGRSRPAAMTSPWNAPPSSQQRMQAGSGMRAVILDGSGSKRGSHGTGVFLPRRDNDPAEARRKPSCSTVLLPARVIQALNLNLDGRLFNHDQDSVIASPRNLSPPFHAERRGNRALHPTPPPARNCCEVMLPQEWTY